jgi:hypothetical protein
VNRLRALLLTLSCAAAPAALALLATARGASAASASSTSANWAGYAVSGARFRRVSASWVQPAATCSSASPAYSAFWVGLGGYARTSQALEQVGTEADCSAAGGVAYRAWYELVPAAPVNAHLTVRPGDAITAGVTVNGHNVSVRIADITRRTVFARRLRMSSPDVGSAEWIAEAPSACDASGSTCRTLPLADFGQIGFSGAAATTGAGHTGTIADPAWSATAITLRDNFGGRGPARFAGAFAAAEADPGALSAAGSGFAVTWQQTRAAAGPGPGGLGPGGG